MLTNKPTVAHNVSNWAVPATLSSPLFPTCIPSSATWLSCLASEWTWWLCCVLCEAQQEHFRWANEVANGVASAAPVNSADILGKVQIEPARSPQPQHHSSHPCSHGHACHCDRTTMSVPPGHTAQFPWHHHGKTVVLARETDWHEKRGCSLARSAHPTCRLAPRTPHVKTKTTTMKSSTTVSGIVNKTKRKEAPTTLANKLSRPTKA